MAYNTSTGAYQTGDGANHTIKLVKDGTEANPTNAISEVDSTNAKGAYKLTLTAAETQFGTVWVGGVSSTANVIIIPITLTFEILPTALNTNNFVKADVENIGGQAVSLDANNLLKVDVEDINGNATAAQNVSKANQAIGRGTVGGGGGGATTVSTSAFTPGGSGIVTNQFVGRTIVFDATTSTVALQGQATTINGNTSGSNPSFSVNSLTTTPALGDTFGVY